MLTDAFGHHGWATLRIVDECRKLTLEQLATTVPGTYGTILDTLRHLVGADASYLFALTGGRVSTIDEDEMDVEELGGWMERFAEEWPKVLADRTDPDEIVIRHRDDGSETHAPVGIRLAQVIHHGTDHRSQICTALTTLGIEPPLIDVWDYGHLDDRVTEIPPGS